MAAQLIPFPTSPNFDHLDAEATLSTLADMDCPAMQDGDFVEHFSDEMTDEEWVTRRNWIISNMERLGKRGLPHPLSAAAREIGAQPLAVTVEAMRQLAYRTDAVKDWCDLIVWAREYFGDKAADADYPECFRASEGLDWLTLAKEAMDR